MPMRERKRMALDATEGCERCGYISACVKVSKHEDRGLCRTCQLSENFGSEFKTPCGQPFCRRCGILIEAFDPERYVPDFCPACKLIQRSYTDSGTNRASCGCEFCNNHFGMSPAQKASAMAFRQARGGSSSGYVETSSEENASSFDPRWQAESLVEDKIRTEWESQQLMLKRKLVTVDCPKVKKILHAVKNKDQSVFYIGGVDISFIKGNNVDACAALVVLSFPELKVVYKRLEMVKLTAPYIPGFLAFREVDFLVSLYRALLKNAPQYKPDVILVDGNGQLHPRGFGLACHLGVLLDTPCVGVGKTLIHVDGIEDNDDHKAKKLMLKKGGDRFPLTTDSGETLGVALRSTNSTTNPIYVSVGHKISLDAAATLTLHCCKYRIPEPTRIADMSSREYLLKEKRDPEEFIYST